MAVNSVHEDDDVHEGIDYIELPFVDLRHFGGDELRLVAQFSGHFPEASFGHIVVPTIDRSCFNESAGSRRQTWCNRGSSSKHSNRRGLGSSKTTSTVLIQRRSIELTSTTVRSHNTHELVMPDAGTRSRTTKAVARLTPNGKVTLKSSARQVAWKRAITRGVTNVAVEEKFATNGEIKGAVGGAAGIVREPLSTKRLRQPIEAFNDDGESEEEIARTRNKKTFRSSAASRDLGKEALVGAKRSRGPLFGARPLEFYQRPERARKRRTRQVDMVGRLNKMKGKWSSTEKTQKIVDASGFPLGWTVRVGLRYQGGRTFFEYCDWRSPDGSLWSSFKDASAYLLSSIGQNSTSKIVLLVKPGAIDDEGTSSSKEENTTQTGGIGNAKGEFCRNEVLRVDLDQAAGRFSNVDKTPNLTLDEFGVEIASNLDELHVEDCHREILIKGQTQEIRQSACLLERHRDHMTKTEDPSKNADLKESPRVSDKTPNLTLPATGAEMASYVDELQAEGCHRAILNEGQAQESGHSACLLVRHSCGDHMTKTEDLSKSADLKESPRISHHESASGWMVSSINSGHSKIKGGQCCTHLTPRNDSGHKCPSCGMMFPSLLQLRGHVRRAKIGRKLNCNVCGRHFSSTALLLSHRVQMGHPRVSGITSQSRRLQAKGLEPVSRPPGSKISNIVLALPSHRIGGNIDHASVIAKPYSKSTENISSRDLAKVVNVDVGQGAEKNGDLSGIFECETCNKVFYRRSQYWGHQSVHAKQRKKALKSSALSGSVSKRSLDRVVGSESNLAMVVRENCEYEAGNKYDVQSVLWRLLDDPSPIDRPNHELDIFQDETVRTPSLHSKEEVTSEIGVLTY